MTQIITEQQARQITGGRKPLVPVEYEEACKQLQACIDIDEAKYWVDKSDALAAWAKIYHDDKVQIDAKRLKLRAFRRMGELAEELRPFGTLKAQRGRVAGTRPGPASLLIELGLSRKQAVDSRRLAKAPQSDFERVVESAFGVSRAASQFRGVDGRGKPTNTQLYHWLAGQDYGGPGLNEVRRTLSTKSAKEVATQISLSEATHMGIRDIVEWLDEFEQYLPKE